MFHVLISDTVATYLPRADNVTLDKSFHRPISNIMPDQLDLPKPTMEDAESHKRPKSPSSNQKIVIILAYMHTGSTYFGSILQHHEGTFYEYENLRSLMYSTRAGKLIHFLNGTSR